MTSDETPAAAAEGRSASLGAAAIFGAKIYFLIASMALGFGLISQLSEQQYGHFFIVNDVVSMVGAVLLAGAIQSMSRHVAQHPDRLFDLRRAGVRTFGRVGGLAAVGIAVAAWPLAVFLGDESLAPLFLVAAPIPFCYALYAAHVGVFNGRRLFGRQAAFDVGFATVKAGLMIAAAVLGFGAFGVLGGFAVTTVLVLLVATPLSRCGNPVEPFPGRSLLAFSVVTLVYVSAINGVLRADTWVIKRGFDDASVGLYSVSLQVARVPYQLSVAVALVIFPFLAATRAGDPDDDTRAYVERALRYGLVLAGLAASLLVGTGSELLYVLDPRKAHAAQLLHVVGPAMLAYTLTYLACTVLVSLGRPGRAVLVSVATLILTVVLTRVGIERPLEMLLPSDALVPLGLLGAAQGVIVANVTGLALAAWVLWRGLGIRLGWRFAATLVLVALLITGGVLWRPAGELAGMVEGGPGRVKVFGLALVKLAALGVAGVVALVATRIVPIAEAKALLRGRKT